MEYTELKDRILWFDGDSSVKSDTINELVLSGIPLYDIFVDEETDEIKQYNKLVPSDKQIHIKDKLNSFETEWKIPKEYFDIDLSEFFFNKFKDEIDLNKDASDMWIATRARRIVYELKQFKESDKTEMLYVLIYIINTLNTNDQAWGIGRGSSVSSYLLYLIGVHDIDSVKYDLDFSDFLTT